MSIYVNKSKILLANKIAFFSFISMASLVEIKKRIDSISSTIKVTKVMQMIATAKIAKIKQMIGVAERYESSASDVLWLFLKNTENSIMAKQFFESSNTNKNVLLLMFSSDKGTCGSINTNIFKETTNIVKEYKQAGKNITIFPIGKRAVKFLQSHADKLGVNVYKTTDTLDAEYCNNELVGKITASVLEDYMNGKYGEISVLFHKFKNIITCIAEKQQLLPIDKSLINYEKADFINIDETENTTSAIIEYFIKTKIYSSYVSNIASIVSSRMNAMDNATKNGQEIIDDLRIQYNKSRQSRITSELSDIVSGFEAIS